MCQGLLPTIRHFENRRGEGPGDEVALNFGYFLCYFKMVAPRALDSCHRPEGSWALGTRMPDGQNSVISFVISKWLLPELSIPAAGQNDRRLWGREWGKPRASRDSFSKRFGRFGALLIFKGCR